MSIIENAVQGRTMRFKGCNAIVTEGKILMDITANTLLEMITSFGFPVTMVFLMMALNYVQNKRYTKSLESNTAAINAMEKAVAIMCERMK
jgi:hypothetical protein